MMQRSVMKTSRPGSTGQARDIEFICGVERSAKKPFWPGLEVKKRL